MHEANQGRDKIGNVSALRNVNIEQVIFAIWVGKIGYVAKDLEILHSDVGTAILATNKLTLQAREGSLTGVTLG